MNAQAGGSQIGVLAPAALSRDSRIVGYDKELRMKSVLADVWSELSGIYDPERKNIPSAIYMKCDERVTGSALEAVITMKMRLRESGVFGNNYAIGTEERARTKSFKIYCNNFRKVVDTPGYGRRELEAKPYGLYEKHVDELADYNKEEEGVEIRQALVERYGETLVYGDTQADCVRNWNPNIFVCGYSRWQDAVPTYSSNRSTYTQAIMTKVLGACGGSLTPTVNTVLNQPNLSHLQNALVGKRITPLPIPGLPGGSGWIVFVSELQAMYMGDPAWSQRNIGGLWKDINRVSEKVMKWPGVIGSWKKLLFIEDPRMPTITPSGTSTPYGMTAGYLWWGDVDERERDDPEVIDLFMACGAAAVVNWTPQKLHHIQQKDDYGAIVGHGTALVRGVQAPVFDQQNPVAGSAEQYSSILGLCRLPAYV